jgi:protein-S-isoprenylcysteine O-methyltransferase Ste14
MSYQHQTLSKTETSLLKASDKAKTSPPEETEKQGTASSMAVASASYLAFLFGFVWLVIFAVPTAVLPEVLSFVPTLDSAPELPADSAVILDFLLVALFGVLHSFFARPVVKRRMGLPKMYERPFFVFQTIVCLIILMANWRNFKAPTLWDTTKVEWLSGLLTGLYMFGVLFLFTASFALDHFSLFGLSQGFGMDLNQMVGLAPSTVATSKDAPPATGSMPLISRWHYSIVAHPIMTAFLIMMWFTAKMTMPHFVFSATFTFYIVMAVRHLEEPDLVAQLGPAYTNYVRSLPRFIPFTKFGVANA